MSDTRSPGVETPAGYRARSGRTHWTGVVGFAAFMMILLGFFQAIAGLAAIFNDDYYHVTRNDLLVNVDISVWGWVHLLVGAGIFLAGMGLLAGNAAARVVGVVLAVISAILALAFANADPAWAAIVILIDILVIYALVVHGRELAEP
jgi:hypothetical protein